MKGPVAFEGIWPLVLHHFDIWRMCREMGTDLHIAPKKLFAGAWIGILVKQGVIMVDCSTNLKGAQL
jgi:hypothetical protein